jgi:L-threonylcarbamoyladenylate synthase
MSDATILQTHTPELFNTAVRQAVEVLKSGQVVALPTETVYGLAANAYDASAVAKIYEIKGRPPHNPIIVHVASTSLARQCVRSWPDVAEKVAQAFWPGPLSLVLPRSEKIPCIVTGGGPTVGLRWPSHPFIQAVIQQAGFPLAAPSANLSNDLSPTSASHVIRALGKKIPLIVDGGSCQVGIESTVLDLSVEPPVVLRPGMISREALAVVVGELGMPFVRENGVALKSPGQLKRHYSPKATLIILDWQDEQELWGKINSFAAENKNGKSLNPSAFHVLAHTHIPSSRGLGGVSVIPHDAEAFARALYSALHQADELGAQVIIIEKLPSTPEWRAIQDRLERASA